SLGHGIGIATGFGLAAKQDGRNSKSYVIMSDGECYEGSVTEAARVTSHKSLDNVVGIIDRNRVCILGNTENLVKLEPMPMEDHWNSLGWYTQRVNGHSYGQLYKAFENAASNNGGRPSMIITDTVKGKGVIEMEGNINYHNKFPTEDKMQAFRRELDNPIDLR
ncbi:MAG: transketolase, partial [Nanoarchaeota archaeon]|nr:transketolase [Nanoarchaeota archaeon]